MEPTKQATAKRILIVEDDLLIRELYSRALRNEGYIVEEAEDGKKGYEAIVKGGYDLVLLDIMLPFMDGLQILEKITKETPPQIPNKHMMLLTNLDQQLAIAKGLEYGVNDYLIKSQFSLEKLRKEIQAVLEKSS
ncbi:hypothetical protein BH09PAT2_BH09PAT2_03150 [soil metagenome]